MSSRRVANAGRDSAESATVSANATAETARIAALDAERTRTGWTDERKSRAISILRNIGTFAESEVRLRGKFIVIGFDRGRLPDPVGMIAPGQSIEFCAAIETGANGGDERTTRRKRVDEHDAELTEPRLWIEQIPTLPKRAFNPDTTGYVDTDHADSTPSGLRASCVSRSGLKPCQCTSPHSTTGVLR